MTHILVAASRVCDSGRVLEFADAIWLQGGVHDSHIVHNEVYNIYYTGINIGWNWGFEPTSNYRNVIQYNHLHDLGLGRLNEVGCTHHLGYGNGTIIDHNLCHDVQSHDNEGYGIWSDQATFGVTYSNNIVYRTKGSSYQHHDGRNVTIINNVLGPNEKIINPDDTVDKAIFSAFLLLLTGDARKGGPSDVPPLHISRNIVFQTNASAGIYADKADALKQGTTIDFNCLWNTAVPPSNLTFPVTGRDHTNTSFAAWQAIMGFDLQSVVADPGFPNAAAWDFSTISANSPCLAVGFVPINMTGVGPAGWWTMLRGGGNY